MLTSIPGTYDIDIVKARRTGEEVEAGGSCEPEVDFSSNIVGHPDSHTNVGKRVLLFDTGQMSGTHKSHSLTLPCHGWAEERIINKGF